MEASVQHEVGGLPFLLSDVVADNARWVPDERALIFQGRIRNWREFAQDIEKIQTGLSSLGVTRGSRVAVLDRNSDDYVLLGYALAGMGAVLVPVNMWLRIAELTYILGNSQPLLLVTSLEFLDAAKEAIAPLAEPPRLILRGSAHEGTIPWQEVAEGKDGQIVSRPSSWDDPHLVLYTSGTTGRPKGALISHRRTILDAMSALPIFGIKERECFFCYMPLFHTGAWDYLKLYFMRRGAAVIAERFEADTAVSDLQEYRSSRDD
jgi:fatty-acyl-CoA synthase